MVSSSASSGENGAITWSTPRRERGDGLVQVVDVGQHLRDQQPVMVGANRPSRASRSAGSLAAQPALGQLGQHLRVVGAGHQRVQHRPAGDAQHVGGHAGQLDPGVLQDLLQPLGLPGALLDQRLAVAGQVAQLPDRLGRHEAGADQPVLDQLGRSTPQSATSVLRPGRCLRCGAFTSQHSNSSSSR